MLYKSLIITDKAPVSLHLQNVLKQYNFKTLSIIYPDNNLVTSVKAFKPDLIIIDLNLGNDLDGTIAINLTLKIKSLLHAAIIFLANYIDTYIFHNAEIVEPDAYIFKPFNENDLYSTVKIILRKIEQKVKISKNKKNSLINKATELEYLARFEAIFKKAGIGIAVVNKKGKIVEANNAFARFLGYSIDEIQNLNFEDFTHPEDAKIDIKLSKELFNGIRDTYQIEKRYIRKDGSIIWGLLTTSLIKNHKEKPDYYIRMVEDITEKKLSHEQLVLNLKEKEVLIKEIHHRVKNNMQLISSLLQLQKKGIKNKDLEIIFEIFYNRIFSMKLVHELSYNTNDFSKINFSKFINKLIIHYSNTAISMIIDIKNDIFLNINKIIPIALIANELISNSLHHAFPNKSKGTLSIKSYIDSNNFVLIVMDDGIGFPENIDIKNPNTLGIQLVNVLCKQLGGHITLNSSDEGTIYKIIFPIN